MCGIPSKDTLFRGAHHPVAFQRKAGLNPAKFMKLYWEASKPELIEASFVWERYAPTLELVHNYGCRTSHKRNENSKPGKRDVYCGAYQLNVDHVRRLVGIDRLPEVVGADVIHKIEHGELAHVASLITIALPIDEDAVEGVKTAIVDRLWNSCRGPIEHICDFDRDLDPHPNNKLDLAPSGRYTDGRSSLMRALCFYRYRLLKFAWGLRFRFFGPPAGLERV
jgi:hypothetical protein